MLKNYDISKDYYVERYFEENDLSSETQKNYTKNLKKFCEAVDKELAEIIEECKNQQTIETEEIISTTNQNGKAVTRKRVIKFDVNGGDSLIKGYFDQFEKYCKAKGNKNTTINTGFDTIKAVLSKFNVELPNHKNLSDDRESWNLLSKDDFQFVLADSSLMHKSLILFMLSTGMRLSDALNMTIGEYMSATSAYHDFIEVDDFIDNAPDDMMGFFDFEPQKTENNIEPTRCMTFNSPESNKFILQNLRRVKNEYLPNKFKNNLEKQKLKKSDSLFGSKRGFYKTSPVAQSISTMFGRKDNKLYEWHINKINQAITDGKISIEDYDKYVDLIPKFHAHACRKYFCTIVGNHTANERLYRLMEGHALKNKLDKSYIDFAKIGIREVYDDAVNDLSIYYSGDEELDKIRDDFNQQLEEQKLFYEEKINSIEQEYEHQIQELEGRVDVLDEKIDATRANIPFHRINKIIQEYLSSIDELDANRFSLLTMMVLEHVRDNPAEYEDSDEYYRDLVRTLDLKIELSNKDIIEQQIELGVKMGNEKIDPVYIMFIDSLLDIIEENKGVMKRIGAVDMNKFDYVAEEYLVHSGIIRDISNVEDDIKNISEEDKVRIAGEIMMMYIDCK